MSFFRTKRAQTLHSLTCKSTSYETAISFMHLGRNIILDPNAYVQLDTFNSILISTPNIVDTLTFTDIIYNNGLLVVISNYNKIMTRNDSNNIWNLITIPIRIWNAITYGNGKFVAISNNGFVLCSFDGINWVEYNTNINKNWIKIAYGNNIFVSISSDGYIMNSTDGITWVLQNIIVIHNNLYRTVVFKNNIFIIGLMTDITNDTGLLISNDGTTWTPVTTPLGNWYSITYGKGLYVALSASTVFPTSPLNQVMTSPDGINWSLQITPRFNPDVFRDPGTTNYFWIGIEYVAGSFVAIARNNNYIVRTSPTLNQENTPIAMTSPDGINWNIRDVPSSYALRGITNDGKKCLAIVVNVTPNNGKKIISITP